MQVNNNVSPNFGMALKIKPSATDYLKTQSKATLETLGKLGEEFKDYKHWDLEVDGNGYHAVGKGFSDGAYAEIQTPKSNYPENCQFSQFFVPVKAEKFVDAGKVVLIPMSYPTSAEAAEAYTKIEGATCGLDRTAAFVRELETLSAKKAYEKAAKEAADAEQTEKINSLISKFGVDE